MRRWNSVLNPAFQSFEGGLRLRVPARWEKEPPIPVSALLLREEL